MRRHTTRLKSFVEYVRSGPEAGDTVIERLLGFWLWWRIWAIAGLLSVSLLPGLWAFNEIGHAQGLFVTWWCGLLFGGWLLMLSPKYYVTKNY